MDRLIVVLPAVVEDVAAADVSFFRFARAALLGLDGGAEVMTPSSLSSSSSWGLGLAFLLFSATAFFFCDKGTSSLSSDSCTSTRFLLDEGGFTLDEAEAEASTRMGMVTGFPVVLCKNGIFAATMLFSSVFNLETGTRLYTNSETCLNVASAFFLSLILASYLNKSIACDIWQSDSVSLNLNIRRLMPTNSIVDKPPWELLVIGAPYVGCAIILQ